MLLAHGCSGGCHGCRHREGGGTAFDTVALPVIRKNTLLYSIATRYQVTLRLDCNMVRQAHALQHYPAVTA